MNYTNTDCVIYNLWLLCAKSPWVQSIKDAEQWPFISIGQEEKRSKIVLSHVFMSTKVLDIICNHDSYQEQVYLYKDQDKMHQFDTREYQKEKLLKNVAIIITTIFIVIQNLKGYILDKIATPDRKYVVNLAPVSMHILWVQSTKTNN